MKKKQPAVFSRLAEDIRNWNTRVAINRSNHGGAGELSHSTPKKSSSAMTTGITMSNSHLGKVILYGNASHQRHLSLKLKDIDQQRVRHMRNLEWKQLEMFRQITKEKLRSSKAEEKRLFSKSSAMTKDKVTLPKINRNPYIVSQQDISTKIDAWEKEVLNTACNPEEQLP